MNTRIKYEYVGPIGISRQTFNVNGREVKLVIDKDEFSFKIVDNDGYSLLEGGNTNNYNVLLRQAKRALTKMGCKFNEENRNRNYGITNPSVKTGQ